MRSEETGAEYVFVSRDAFEQAIADDVFYEWAEFHGNLYGTPQPTPPEDCDVLLEIEVQGAQQVKERHPGSTVILLEPPSLQELESRLRGRGDSDDHVGRRLVSSDSELTIGREIADFVIVNHDLETTLAEVRGIIDAVRQSHD
jgi:guanylate kinase